MHDRAQLLYLVGQLRAGGLERQLYYLLRELIRGPYSAEVVVWSFREEEIHVEMIRELGVKIHSIDPALPSVQKMKTLRRLVRARSPQVVHSYSFYTNFAAAVAARNGTIAVGSSRSDFAAERRRAGFVLGRLSARWPRCLIANNSASARAAQRSGFFRPARICVVRNGVDLDSFRAVAENTDVPILIGVGSLHPEKRWDRLLKVCGRLKRQGRRFRLRFVGDGPMRPALVAEAAAQGLEGEVEFLGQRTDVPDLLASSSILVHTSVREGCPNVVMEAMAAGRPVVATDVGDVAALVDHGATGFVLRTGDEPGLLERLRELLDGPRMRRDFGLAGRRKAEREFSLGRLLSGTLAAYQSAGWKP